MLAVILILILNVFGQPGDGRRISIIDIVTTTQKTKQLYNNVDQGQLTNNTQKQYNENESMMMKNIANECGDSQTIHQKVEDHVFMALFESINVGCIQVQNIWSYIPFIDQKKEEKEQEQQLINITYAIGNKTFNESINYGIPQNVIETIITWLEPGLNKIDSDLPYDISYHIYKWLLQRKYIDINYFHHKCDFINNDPIDIFTNIESTLQPIHDCMTRQIIDYEIDNPEIKLNCSKINKWNKNFVLALEFNIQISFILGITGGIGVGVELKTIAQGEFYWKAGGGLSLFFGFSFGIAVPYVADLKYLNGGTIKLGGGLEIGIVIEYFVLFNNKFEFIGRELDIGVGIGEVINIDLEYIERKSIKQFKVNLTAICSSKTLRPSGHPTFRPNNHPTFRPNQHPTFRPNQHPTHKPIKIPTRNPSHPTFRPPAIKYHDY